MAAFFEALPADAGVGRRQMFGYPRAFVNGNLFCGLHEHNICVRVGRARAETLVGAARAAVFAPMAGRVMREYVAIPGPDCADPTRLAPWLQEALAYIARLPAKERPTGAGSVMVYPAPRGVRRLAAVSRAIPTSGGACHFTAMSEPSAESVVREFWRLMASNDFESVKSVLAPEFVVEWPQSGERIRGPERFCRMNAEYPTSSHWRFRINHLVASGEAVVTQVSLTDGTQSAEPVSFFTVHDGKVTRLLEYWPEPFAPAENRGHLVERMA